MLLFPLDKQILHIIENRNFNLIIKAKHLTILTNYSCDVNWLFTMHQSRIVIWLEAKLSSYDNLLYPHTEILNQISAIQQQQRWL